MIATLSLILATFINLIPQAIAIEPDTAADSAVESTTQPTSTINNARDLLTTLGKHDLTTNSLVGEIRFTSINTLENDRQMRLGDLAILRQPDGVRNYAVSFNTLLIGDRQADISEHFIFDGHWFVERLPKEKQFNKRELVPDGETLDPMELMRDAPFWVSLGHDQDRLLKSYEAELLATDEGLTDNEDFPELQYFADSPITADTYQIMLTPKPGSGFEDDWKSVRIWINKETLLPALYIKTEWTEDLQIVELFKTKTNTEISNTIFDTTSPDARSGWNVQVSSWRGNQDSNK